MSDQAPTADGQTIPIDGRVLRTVNTYQGMSDREATTVQERLWALGVGHCPIVEDPNGGFSVQVRSLSDDDDSLMFTIHAADVPPRGW